MHIFLGPTSPLLSNLWAIPTAQVAHLLFLPAHPNIAKVKLFVFICV